MGEVLSKFAKLPSEFSEEPWRQVRGWNKSARDDLKAEISRFYPETRMNVHSFNIVLMGEIGAGKSSFFNSINSIFKQRMTAAKAPVGTRGSSLTREFMMYDVGRDASIRIGDTMGVEKDTSEADIRNILSVVDGHVPHGYVFAPNENFCSGSPGYIAKPSIADRAHCVAIVVNVESVINMPRNMVNKLKSLAEGLWSRKVPFMVLLTHVDERWPELKKDVNKTFHHLPLQDMISKISKMVQGLPENQIFPVINYQKDLDLNDKMDILLLYSLRTMVYAAQGYIETVESVEFRHSIQYYLQIVLLVIACFIYLFIYK